MLSLLDNIGPTELILLTAILVFFFGSKIITRFAKMGGETFREIRGIKKEFLKSLEIDDKGAEAMRAEYVQNVAVDANQGENSWKGVAQ